MALNYLMRAGQLTKVLSLDPDTLEYAAKTRLNTSALYAELRRFREAVDHAEQCLTILQAELNVRLNGKLLKQLNEEEKEKFDYMMVTYVTAFYNIGLSVDGKYTMWVSYLAII
jgi:tetratricopeptide (TPR) repeat protein